jgi:hypothetical protein
VQFADYAASLVQKDQSTVAYEINRSRLTRRQVKGGKPIGNIPESSFRNKLSGQPTRPAPATAI